jgi:hypothetical protein
MSYPIDRSKWHKPTYDGHYDALAIEYEGIRCRCKRCESSFIYEPAEQKRQLEELGRFPFWLPSLCDQCQAQWEKIGTELKSYEMAWQNKELLDSDTESLNKWLSLILLSRGFHKKDYSSRANMLTKILAAV